MSFILEALKKSEQQRQEKNATQQKVRKRTLSLPSNSSGSSPYWLLGLLPLALLCGWLLYSASSPTREPGPELSPVASAPPAINQPKEPAPVVTSSAPQADSLQQSAPLVELAPVPIVYAPTPRADSSPIPAKDPASAIDSSQDDVPVVIKTMKNEEPVATVVTAHSQPVDNLVLESGVAQLPRYSELSQDLRERMSPLTMSMHFYNSEPNRRLVRINEQLLREGDWVNRDLELVEITPNGVILDFLGTAFELPGSKR